MGESLGGAVLIESLAIEPRFSAIVADSAYSSFERIARDRVARRLPFPTGNRQDSGGASGLGRIPLCALRSMA